MQRIISFALILALSSWISVLNLSPHLRAASIACRIASGPHAGPQYAGRLGEDPGLSRATALRAITVNSSYALHQEAETGSPEVGKFADCIVLLTAVGGRNVYRFAAFAP